MTWLAQFFSAAPKLSPQQAQRLALWRALPEPGLAQLHGESRYVVVDVETSGLNLDKDRLIAIGAVALQSGKIALADSLEVVLQQERASDRGNILIHGIGAKAQTEGTPRVEALLDFLEYLGNAPRA